MERLPLELQIAIFVDVPPHQIFTLRRVSRTWRDFLSSPTLEQEVANRIPFASTAPTLKCRLQRRARMLRGEPLKVKQITWQEQHTRTWPIPPDIRYSALLRFCGTSGHRARLFVGEYSGCAMRSMPKSLMAYLWVHNPWMASKDHGFRSFDLLEIAKEKFGEVARQDFEWVECSEQRANRLQARKPFASKNAATAPRQCNKALSPRAFGMVNGCMAVWFAVGEYPADDDALSEPTPNTTADIDELAEVRFIRAEYIFIFKTPLSTRTDIELLQVFRFRGHPEARLDYAAATYLSHGARWGTDPHITRHMVFNQNLLTLFRRDSKEKCELRTYSVTTGSSVPLAVEMFGYYECLAPHIMDSEGKVYFSKSSHLKDPSIYFSYDLGPKVRRLDHWFDAGEIAYNNVWCLDAATLKRAYTPPQPGQEGFVPINAGGTYKGRVAITNRITTVGEWVYNTEIVRTAEMSFWHRNVLAFTVHRWKAGTLGNPRHRHMSYDLPLLYAQQLPPGGGDCWQALGVFWGYVTSPHRSRATVQPDDELMHILSFEPPDTSDCPGTPATFMVRQPHTTGGPPTSPLRAEKVVKIDKLENACIFAWSSDAFVSHVEVRKLDQADFGGRAYEFRYLLEVFDEDLDFPDLDDWEPGQWGGSGCTMARIAGAREAKNLVGMWT
ncbi:hypothetical protein BDZ91DRAFT_786636 [Kalaharituber pfeilii]|nr:hypothetical protein BDZ91DRAFT_786636 [Kalaharituber pfeilii]